MNIGALFIFSDFNYGRKLDEGGIRILAGNYRDFDT